MSNMNTYSGRRFEPLHIEKEDVCPEDIAHALSLLCRGGGHVQHFYSVGQHSLNCAKEAKARGWSERVVLACLLHDASEAYLSDIIRPVKEHLANYLEIESKIMKVVWEKFGLSDLTEEEMDKIRRIDDGILEHELEILLRSGEKAGFVLYGTMDFKQRNCREVEREFIEMLGQLWENDLR